jgi:2-polyprenyl-3-methyl-5-hydroxy-6-metoxy-1,4-benzoquinol methylase
MTATIDSSVKFWNRFAKRYAKKPVPDAEVYQKKLALTREYLNPDATVLEFGCGTGSTALLHAPYVKNIVALDSSAKMIEIAEGKAREEGVDNVEFQCAALEDMQVPAAAFDVILGLNVLHLMRDWRTAIARCHELLAPGGTFITSTACVAGAGFLTKLFLPIGGKLGLIPKVEIFTDAALDEAMKDAGFTIVQDVKLNKDGLNAFIIARK